MRARFDILEQHADEAAFLYARLRRSHRILDGNGAQTRSLLDRIDAHLDALAVFASDAAPLFGAPAGRMLPEERFVATAVAATQGERAGELLAGLADAKLSGDGRLAVRDAFLRYASQAARGVVDAWLAEGGDGLRATGVELLGLWRDPRAVQVAERAVRRGSGLVRAAGVCALGRLGVDVGDAVLHQSLAECAEATDVCEELLDTTARLAPHRALGAARAWVERGGPRCDLAWVLLGLSAEASDVALLWGSLARGGARGALPAALAMAGQHPRLDPCWEGAGELAVSNALREAAYVVLGGEAPPVVVRDDMPEEPEDRATRAQEDQDLRVQVARVGAGAWRWGASAEGLAETAEALGPRPRRWCLAAMALAGVGGAALWDDVSSRVAPVGARG